MYELGTTLDISCLRILIISCNLIGYGAAEKGACPLCLMSKNLFYHRYLKIAYFITYEMFEYNPLKQLDPPCVSCASTSFFVFQPVLI